MTSPAAPSASAEQPGFHLDMRVVRAFGRFAGAFWVGPTAKLAWALTLGLALVLSLSTLATVWLNHWNRAFFDALEKRDLAAFKGAVAEFPIIILAMAAVGVGIVLTRETLQVRWRAWLVEQLLSRWLDKQRFYHLNTSGKEPPNPEYRISDDTRWATEIVVDLGIGLFSAVIGATAFISILWRVGGSYTVGAVTIPAYMVLLALIYGAAASGLMLLVGRPLVGRVGQKNEAEGYFRFAMMRLRDNAESIALLRGAAAERRILDRFYADVVTRWLAIVKSHGHVTWITNASGPMIPIVPLVFAAPKYLAGDLTLGQVTQLAAAFIQVQIAISWLVDNFNRIAEWYASARRVMDIKFATDEPVPITPIDAIPKPSAVGGLALAGVAIKDGSGKTLIAPVDFTLKSGEMVQIAADSGLGKSTLIRAIAGMSRPASGVITYDPGMRLIVTPQRAYVPLGSLEGALKYPDPDLAAPRAALISALASVGLGHLGPRLDDVERWDQILAAGERQRLALARLFVHSPDIVILDEALSALEEPAQVALLSKLRSELAGATILVLSQRLAPSHLFDRQLSFERAEGGARLNLAKPALSA
jgi:putative ATP-binding cassette transporter